MKLVKKKNKKNPYLVVFKTSDKFLEWKKKVLYQRQKVHRVLPFEQTLTLIQNKPNLIGIVLHTEDNLG